MEFFVDNWFWFLVGGIFILMTLIGYIAEKTDFGRKEMPKAEKVKKAKKEKKKPNEKQELTQALGNEEPKPEVQMSLATDSILEEPVSRDSENNVKSIEDLNAPFGDMTFEEPIVSEETTDFEMPETVYEQSTEELNDSEDLVFAEPDLETEVAPVVEEDLNVPFGDITLEEPVNGIEEVVASEPVEELNLSEVSTPNIELPDLDSIVTEEDDTDDVWKF